MLGISVDCTLIDTAINKICDSGFASKMGLASGPAIAAIIVGENDYALVIWAAVIGLVLCVIFVIYPASLQDRS